MAKFTCDIPADFLSDLLDSDFSEIAEESLEEAAPVLQKSVQDSVRAVLKDKSRTELIESFQPWKGGVKKTSTGGGAYIMGVSPYGKPGKKSKRKRSDGTGTRNVTNNDIAWWLEHGNSHQAAKPYLDRGAKAAEGAILDIVQEVYNKKVGAT
jgi:hypothetical protein